MQAIKDIFTLTILMLLATIFTFGIAIPIIIIYFVCVFYGAPKRIESAMQKLNDSLMDGESIIESAHESRIYSLASRRSLIAITDSRAIYFKRPLFGGFNMIDIQWKDVIDAQLSQNLIPSIFGSQVSFTHSLDKSNIYINVTCEVATSIYRFSQKEEQAWEEKRRIRKIEERRAAAGGTYISTLTPSETSPKTGGPSLIDAITSAKEMFDQGIISDSEFYELKSKILNQGQLA